MTNRPRCLEKHQGASVDMHQFQVEQFKDQYRWLHSLVHRPILYGVSSKAMHSKNWNVPEGHFITFSKVYRMHTYLGGSRRELICTVMHGNNPLAS